MVTVLDDRRDGFARLVGRDLGLREYLDAVDRTMRRLVPFELGCVLSLDPATVLPTSHFSRELDIEHLMLIVANEFLEDDVNKFADLARRSPPVATLRQATNGDPTRSRRHTGLLTEFGFADGDELRAVFRDGDVVWGAIAIHRREGAFTDSEIELVADAGPAIARGIRRAILRSALAHGHDPEAPGLILLRADSSVETSTAQADRWVSELFDEGLTVDAMPMTVVSVAARARQALAAGADGSASVRLPRRSGGWLRLDASVLDDEDPRVAVIISPAREPEVASLIVEIYGLSNREREVTRLVLHGHSTAEIGATLHVSNYTVQDHLKSIFGKVGVRSRRELVSQLFLQQWAPRLAAGLGPRADGWFADRAPRDPIGPGPIDDPRPAQP
jgi:DNA-binding CsgD family transcriptional regulator